MVSPVIHMRKRRVMALFVGGIIFVFLCVHLKDAVTGSGYVKSLPPDWKEILSFVPSEKVKCQDLFTEEEKKDPYDDIYSLALADFNNYMYENNIQIVEGYCAAYQEENMAIWRLARTPFIQTVCETGFNAGHSALMWLTVNPNIKVYSFDLGQYEYSFQMAIYLQNKFPGRLKVTWGDSRYTLYDFRFKYPDVTCDLILIDGGHIYDVLHSDYRHFYHMANVDNIVILDNYPDPRFQDLGKVWEGAKKKGTIQELFSCSYLPEKEQGFSFGKFVKYT